jgi:hypothetical protein
VWVAVVGHKRGHPQVFAHRMRMKVQDPDDICLRFPLRGQFMHPACALPPARLAEDWVQGACAVEACAVDR